MNNRDPEKSIIPFTTEGAEKNFLSGVITVFLANSAVNIL